MPSELRRGTTGTHFDTSSATSVSQCNLQPEIPPGLPGPRETRGCQSGGCQSGGGAPSLAMGYLRAYAASIASLLAGASVVHWALVPDLALPDLGAAKGEGGTPADSGGR